jgi:hypothetical protein
MIGYEAARLHARRISGCKLNDLHLFRRVLMNFPRRREYKSFPSKHFLFSTHSPFIHRQGKCPNTGLIYQFEVP